jgi:hypothetical protein
LFDFIMDNIYHPWRYNFRWIPYYGLRSINDSKQENQYLFDFIRDNYTSSVLEQ